MDSRVHAYDDRFDYDEDDYGYGYYNNGLHGKSWIFYVLFIWPQKFDSFGFDHLFMNTIILLFMQ